MGELVRWMLGHLGFPTFIGCLVSALMAQGKQREVGSPRAPYFPWLPSALKPQGKQGDVRG